MDVVDSKLESAALDRIKHLIENKADKSEVNLLSATLSTKAEKADVEFMSASLSNLRLDNEHRILDLEKKLNLYKSDLDGFENYLGNIERKAEGKDLERLTQLVAKKIDADHVNNTLNKLRNELGEDINYIRDELHQFKRTTNEEIGERHGKSKGFLDKMNDDVHRLSEQVKQMLHERRHDLEETTNMAKTISNNAKKELQLTTDSLAEDLQRIRREVEEGLSKKIDKKEWSNSKSKLAAQLEAKADLMEVQNVIDTWQNDLNIKFKEHREEFKNMIRDHENELYNVVSKKANVSDVNSALNGKIDTVVANGLLNEKVDLHDFDVLRQKITKIAQVVEESVQVKEFDDLAHKCIKSIEELQKDVGLKANISDVCTLLDAKSSRKNVIFSLLNPTIDIDDVNRALVDIHKELDTKPNNEELVAFNKEQSQINETLCTENIAARWAWKSGELKSGSMVPWEIQLSNTLPDNFLWEKDKTNVLTVAPGLYEVNFFE